MLLAKIKAERNENDAESKLRGVLPSASEDAKRQKKVSAIFDQSLPNRSNSVSAALPVIPSLESKPVTAAISPPREEDSDSDGDDGLKRRIEAIFNAPFSISSKELIHSAIGDVVKFL